MTAYLETVAFDNIKGQSRTYKLGPKTLIVGPNGSGKTALLNAVELALEGCASDVGVPPRPWVKSAPLIGAALRSGPALSVKATWSDNATSKYYLAEGKNPVRQGPQGAPLRPLWEQLRGNADTVVRELEQRLFGAVEVNAVDLLTVEDRLLLPPEAYASPDAPRQHLTNLRKELQRLAQQKAVLDEQIRALPATPGPDPQYLLGALNAQLAANEYRSIEEVQEVIRTLENAAESARQQAEAARMARGAREEAEAKRVKPSKAAARTQRDEEREAAREDAKVNRAIQEAFEKRTKAARRKRRGEALIVVLEWQQERLDDDDKPQCCLLCSGALPSKKRMKKMQEAAQRLLEDSHD